ncbi:uncharacterized protein LOC109947336 [Prunus persica]|uniref:uncharacterized protein LOC109947336 n=1 Tax=Prunus persica TaxID=3760 RepID=UPI0009AB8B03|nr:uncharacterized protein LOC109947336 [Prunus persica]
MSKWPKAYDRVEWVFLRAMMLKLGFSATWVSKVMDCISTTTFSVLWKGTLVGHIMPQRGLRQGCPLSPYLFLMCTEGFSCLLRGAERRGDLVGVQVARGAPSVTHLLFADDSILFMKATNEACMALETLFQTYEEVTGQQISYSKSALSLSPNATRADFDMIEGVLNVLVVQCHENYLGLPTIAGMGRKQLFQHLKDKLWKHISGWKEKLLSRAGKKILIKAVLQAIPTYSMSCFRIPKGLCKELNGIMARFWWAKAKDKRGIHWVKWELLCKRQWNVPLLKDIFWDKEVDAILQIPLASLAGHDCLIWHYERNGMYLVKSGYRLAGLEKDKMRGEPSARVDLNSKFWKKIWALKIPNENKFFLWRCAWDFLPCGQILFNRKIAPTPICPKCHRKAESVLHAVWLCEAAKDVWRNSAWGNVCEVWRVNSFRELWHALQLSSSGEEQGLFAYLCWGLWNRRNSFIFEGKSETATQLLYRMTKLAQEYMLGRRSQSHELIPYDPELENTLRYLHRDKNKQDTLPIKMGDELELNNLTRPLKDFTVPKALDQPSCIAYPATTTTFEIKSGTIHLLPQFYGKAGG